MRLFILGAMLIALCGCAGGLHSSTAAARIYLLRAAPAPAEPAGPTASTATLQVMRPFAGPGLESEHIAIVEPEHRVSFYAGSQWAASLPVLVETLVVETLRASPSWAAVNDSESTFGSEYILQINIRRFEADYTQASIPTARVSLECALGRRASRELLASFSVDAEAPASANRLSAVVAAFDAAMNTALAQLSEKSALALKSSQARLTP